MIELKTQKEATNKKRSGNNTTKSISKRTHNQSQQATSSVTSSVPKKPLRYNEGQQNNDITSSTRNDDINNTASENEDTASSASSSDHESGVDLVPLLASSSYKNDDIIRPLPVSSLVRRNDSATPLSISSSVLGDDITLSSPISSSGDLPPKRPAQFQHAENEFEIALWLANRKRIHIKLQLQDEFKALFLRTRNNSTMLYEEIIVKVCKITKTDPRLRSLTKDVGGWYNMYHYNFHTAIVKLALEFKSIYESNQSNEIKKNPTIHTKLGVFVCQVTKAILIAQDEKKETQNVIRKFDEYTIDLEILTKLGIVGLLPVQELLGS
ncbi:hypothetical protein F8M41_023286 [Gigaspora margarita]|uniref:Uncharacterized protein n=1 Tax=Gigaspora margarita TaxID=4874 RepID=A0A8H4B0V9_GIGMA|nr:hypothetical protein F8M41_023286 [Gigaspora margarita]